MHSLRLKTQSEPHIQIFKMAAPSLLHNHIPWNLSHISFLDFSGKIMTYRQDYDVITREFPPKLGIPRFRVGTCVPTP